METEREKAERELAEKLNEEAAQRIKDDPENKRVSLEEVEAAERAFLKMMRLLPCGIDGNIEFRHVT